MSRTLAIVALALSAGLYGCKGHSSASDSETKPVTAAPRLRGMVGTGPWHVVKASGEELQGTIIEIKDPDFTVLETDGASSKLPISRVHKVVATGQTAHITPKLGAAEGTYSLWEFEKTDGSRQVLAVYQWPVFSLDLGSGNIDRRTLWGDALKSAEAP
ncbi:MAG: hypothetical protein HY901_33560 [Deltaproteobacteria bacterium]|nr:hypothetical protein [Deltaproteobacteria bacterium]